MTTAAEPRGDRLDDLWATTTRRLRAFVARRVGASDVEDVTQDILVRILRSGQDADIVEATPAWLYTVARNAVIDHYRTRRRHAPLPADLDEVPDEPAHAAPHVDLQDAARCLRPAVAMLAEPYRSAVTMVDLDGMTHVAAAAEAGISVPGMKSRVQRGRRKLAEVMRTWCRVELGEHGLIESGPCVCGCAAC